MALPNTDPSLPSNPAPVFADTNAARGDEMRANNNKIWGNLSYLEAEIGDNWLRTIYGDNAYGSTLVTDLNAVTKSGFYTCYGAATGAPSTGYSWFVIHQNSAVGTVSAYQRAVAFSTGLIVYERTRIASAWGVWALIGASGEITTINISGSAHTLTDGSLRASMIIFTGATSSATITWPSTITRQSRLKNSTVYTLYVKTSSGTGIYMAPGDLWDVYCDGVNVVPIKNMITRIISLGLSGAQAYTSPAQAKIVWNTVSGDVLSEMSAGVFTAKNKCTVSVSVSCGITSISTTYINSSVFVNSAVAFPITQVPYTPTAGVAGFYLTYPLNAGDTLDTRIDLPQNGTFTAASKAYIVIS